MRLRPALSVVSGVAAIALASMLIASPAAAAPLPDGQRIDVIFSPDFEVGPWYGEMYQAEADLSDGITLLTPAPDGPQAGASYAEGVDVNDDGLGYAVVQQLATDGPDPELWVVDANTGAMTDPHDIVGPNEDTDVEDCQGIDVQPSGQILVTCFGSIPNPQGGRLDANFIGTLALEPEGGDAILTPIVTISELIDIDLNRFTAIAINPVNGAVWAFGEGNEDVGWYPVDLDGGSIGEIVPAETFANGADFDRDGQLWVTARGDTCDFMMTVDPSTGDNIDYYGCWEDAEGERFRDVTPITIWGAAPALPATGPENTLTIGLGTALLFLLGAVFIARSRLRSTTSKR